jgi:peptidoglycan/LPS O-acetylase OafA/YrhL
VAVGHGLHSAGFLMLKGPLGLVLRGDAAVSVFMILSGFVITHLLLREDETYVQYITRRFFRLYPAFVVCCAAGFLLSGPWVNVIHHVSWQDAPGWQSLVSSESALHREAHSQWQQALLHAVMLHGVVPKEVLDGASMTFLGPAWSISLEWQFYLVAPLVLALRRSTLGLAAGAALALLLFHLHASGRLGHYNGASSLAGSSIYFAIGVASRLAFDSLSRLKASPLGLGAVALFAVIALAKDALPLAIWSPFFIFLVWGQSAQEAGGVFTAIAANRASLFVGAISYSLYLVHRPVQMAAAWLAFRMHPHIGRLEMLAVQGLAVLASIAIAWLLHRFVEVPGINLGKRMAARLGEGSAAEATA